LPGRSPVPAGVLAPARWFADVERWRIAKVRPPAAGAEGARQRPGPEQAAAASDPGLWLDVAHAVVVFPVALVTSVVTALWWFVGLATATFGLRHPHPSPESLRPQSLYMGSAQSHIDLSLGLTSPAGRVAFMTVAGLLLLLSLPLVTRACAAAQTGLGQALLWDASALHRRISGLEQERDTARAQTVAAVSAEATALRRLERDIHDGPQQRLVRLAMELGPRSAPLRQQAGGRPGGARRRHRLDPGGAGRATGPVAGHCPADPRRPRPARGAHRPGRALRDTR